MTPPARITTLLRFASHALAAATLAFGIFSSPASASPSPQAIPNLQGLHLAGEATVPTLRDMVVRAGLDAVGTPYVWGGDDPDGFDCSGLVLFVYREVAGLKLPRTAHSQRRSGKAVDRNRLEPGDLVFFRTRGRAISHVGIYIGHGQFVHAPNRRTVVRVDSLDNVYWSRTYAGARRYIEPGSSGRLIAQAGN